MGEIREIPPRLTRTEWNALVDHGLEKPTSFIIRSGSSSGLYEAINGSNGVISYSGSDASTIIQNTNDALTNGGKIYIRKESTSYLCNTSIGLSSGVVLDSDLAVLAANWATDYSPTALGLPANFPPILYNKDYGPAYGKNERIIIRNLILQGNQGQVGTEPGGAIPIRMKGVDDLRIETVIIDNESLAGGSGHAQMAQAGLSIDRYCRRVKIDGVTQLGGWAGFYEFDPKLARPAGYPTEANGANLRTEITNFIIKLAGGSDPFPAGYSLGVNISDGFVYFKADLVFDLQQMERVTIDNISCVLDGSAGAGISITNYVRDLTVNNFGLTAIGAGTRTFIGLGTNVSKTHFSNCWARNIEQGIDLTNNAPSTAMFVNCDLSEITDPTKILINAGAGLGTLKCKQVRGYVNENHGVATILNGESSIVVVHGLQAAPQNIRVTGAHSEVVNLYVDTVGGTNMTIHAADGNVTGDRAVYWYGSVNTVV